MITLSLQDDFAALDRRLERMLDPAARGVATRQALNKVAAKARTTARRQVRAHYNLKASEINPRISLAPARGSDLDRLIAVVQALPSPSTPGRSMNVIRFVVRRVSRQERQRRKTRGIDSVVRRETRRGRTRTFPVLFFQIRRDGVPQRIRGAFIGNRGRTVFRRLVRGRLPIESVQTIDVTQMFAARKVLDPVVQRIRDELPIEVERALRRALERT